ERSPPQAGAQPHRTEAVTGPHSGAERAPRLSRSWVHSKAYLIVSLTRALDETRGGQGRGTPPSGAVTGTEISLGCSGSLSIRDSNARTRVPYRPRAFW